MKIAGLLLALLIGSCGGGTPVSGPIVPAPELRKDLLFGYFAGTADTVLESSDHANLHWVTGWAGVSAWHLEVARELQLAKGAGIKCVVLMLPIGMVWGENAKDEVRFQFTRIEPHLAGFDCIAVYHTDEPEIPAQGARMDAAVTEVNRWLREIMADFPAMRGAKLAVLYACGSGQRPGIASYDWVGCDDYGAGCGVLTGAYAELKRSGKRLILVPGGWSPFRQDPACFESFAHGDPQVVAIVPFLWRHPFDPLSGIAVNGMRRLYCEAGRKILAAPLTGC